MRGGISHLHGGGVFEGGMFGVPVRRSLGYFGDFGQAAMPMPIPPAMTAMAVEAAEEAQAAALTAASPLIQQVIAMNSPIMAEARVKLEEFKKNRALIPKLPLPDQRKEAQDIIEEKYPPGFLGIGRGKYNLGQLAERVETYLAEPADRSFYRYVLDGTEVRLSDTRAKRYENFKQGNTDLRNYMRQFLPTEVVTLMTTKTIGFDSSKLLADAQKVAATAKANKDLKEAVAARTLAAQALEAAKLEKNDANTKAAQALFDEMDTLVQSLGGKPAARPEGIPLWVYLALGGGALAIIGLIYMMARK